MASKGRISYYIDKYGVFHKIIPKESDASQLNTMGVVTPIKPHSVWLRLIVMFWNARVMKAAFRFGVAAVIMNQYERLGFAVLLLCFAL